MKAHTECQPDCLFHLGWIGTLSSHISPEGKRISEVTQDKSDHLCSRTSQTNLLHSEQHAYKSPL